MRKVQCKNCVNLKDHWCKFVLDSPDEELKRYCGKFQQITNADRIRAMTDEELARKMAGLESFAITCGGGWPPEKWLDWLRQEATP